MLRMVGIEPYSGRPVSWSIECPVPGVVLINLNLVSALHPAPFHWRVGTWRKPPLDIEIEPSSGCLQAIQFALQDEQVPLVAVASLPAGKSGLPVFDTGDWPIDRYLDVHGQVTAIRTPADQLGLFVSSGETTSTSQIPGLVLGYDHNSNVHEIRIGPLADEDWDAIVAMSVGARETTLAVPEGGLTQLGSRRPGETSPAGRLG